MSTKRKRPSNSNNYDGTTTRTVRPRNDDITEPHSRGPGKPVLKITPYRKVPGRSVRTKCRMSCRTISLIDNRVERMKHKLTPITHIRVDFEYSIAEVRKIYDMLENVDEESDDSKYSLWERYPGGGSMTKIGINEEHEMHAWTLSRMGVMLVVGSDDYSTPPSDDFGDRRFIPVGGGFARLAPRKK